MYRHSIQGKVEVRAIDGGKTYLDATIPYNTKSEDMGNWREVIRPAAFTRSLREEDIKAVWAHDYRFILGRTGGGTFKIEDRAESLFCSVELPDTSWARDLASSVQRGDVPGVSFGFKSREGGSKWEKDENGQALRNLIDVRLVEISYGVAFPAYPASNAGVSQRSLLGQDEQRELEGILNSEPKDDGKALREKQLLCDKLRILEAEILL